MSILVLDTPEAKLGLTGDEQNLSTDVLNMLEEVVVVKVGHMLRIRGAGEGPEYKDEVQEANKGYFLSVPAGHLAGAHHGHGRVYEAHSSLPVLLRCLCPDRNGCAEIFDSFRIHNPDLYRNVGLVRAGKTGGLSPR